MTIEDLIRAVVRDELAKAKPVASAYLSTAEAAAFARVSTGTIRRWVRSGALTRHEAGARVLVLRDEVERHLRCTVTPIDVKLTPEERARRRFG